MARSASSQFETNGTSVESAEALDQRVRRLELAVAALQDTQLMEDRVVERVARRVDHHVPSNGSNPLLSSAALIVNATKMLLPKSADAAAVDREVLPQDPAAAKPTWFLWDLFGELRTMTRMFYDYRFRMSWIGRVVPLAGFIVFVFSWFLLPNTFLGLWGLLPHAVTATIAVVVYKALSREVVRYNDLMMRIRYRS